MKRAISWLVCVLLCVGMLPMTVGATEENTMMVFTVETHQATAAIKAGEEFDITVSISAAEALACIECKLRYDKTLITPIKAEKQGFLNECLMADVNIAPVSPHTNDPEKYGEVWITGLADGDKSVAAEQIIGVITFKANADLSQSTVIDIFMTPIAARSDMMEYTCDVKNGGIKFEGSEMPETPPTMTPPTVVVPSGNAATATTTQAQAGEAPKDNTLLIIMLVAGAVILGGGVAVYAIKTKKRSAG